MPRSVRIRKLEVVWHADVLDENGNVIGEVQGSKPAPIFRGSELFPAEYASVIERSVKQEDLEKL